MEARRYFTQIRTELTQGPCVTLYVSYIRRAASSPAVR